MVYEVEDVKGTPDYCYLCKQNVPKPRRVKYAVHYNHRDVYNEAEDKTVKHCTEEFLCAECFRYEYDNNPAQYYREYDSEPELIGQSKFTYIPITTWRKRQTHI